MFWAGTWRRLTIELLIELRLIRPLRVDQQEDLREGLGEDVLRSPVIALG